MPTADVPSASFEETHAPSIEVRADGPYIVSGVPLSRIVKVTTAFGEPVGWGPERPLETGATYSLCRCGRSSTKPFCDETHTRVPFDGTETADRGPSALRRKTFVGYGVVMTDDRSLCQHAGFCGDRYTNAWRMTRSTDDPAVRERLIAMVRLCPAGALGYAEREGDEPVEPVLPIGIAVVRDGPLRVQGRIPVTAADGVTYEVRNRVTLCRCGASRNKPFCDGSHQDVGFRDG
jgi:CDGSH-type Zn-finger protein